MKDESLITLKTFQRIGSLSYHAKYESTRSALEEFLGNGIGDISNITEATALKVVKLLEMKIHQSKMDKTYKAPVPVESGNGRKRNFGLEGKKKPIVIE